MTEANYYELLGVTRNAPPEVIRAAYKALAQKYHPDKNPGDAEASRVMADLNKAAETLLDPERRQAYDERWFGAKATAAPESQGPQEPPESKATQAAAPIKSKQWWSRLAEAIIMILLIKLIGAIGTIIAGFVFYWLRPKRGTGQAAVASVVAGFAIAAIFSTALQATWKDGENPAPQAQATPQDFSQNSRPAPPSPQQTPQVNWSDFTPVEESAPERAPPPPPTTPAPAQTKTPQPSPSAQKIHMQKIYAAHPDADAIFTNADFQDWLKRTPHFQNTPSVGTTQEVIDMFSAYKRLQRTEHQQYDQENARRNEAAAEDLARQYAPAYPR